MGKHGRDRYGRWLPSGVWIVELGRDGSWHCSDGCSLESANYTATLLMMKHPIKRDMTQARVVSDSRIGFGIPRLAAPEYIDYGEVRLTPLEVWVVPALSRYKALRIAQKDWAGRAIGREVQHCRLCGGEADRLYGVEVGKLLSLGISREKLGLGVFSFSSRRKAWMCKTCLEQLDDT